MKKPEILVVEDNRGDQVLFQEGMAQLGLSASIHFVEDGERALQFLKRQPPFADCPRPDVIVLDLNLPKMSGREVLAALKKLPALSDIPVIVMSTSNSPEDKMKTQSLGAAAYVTKPNGLSDYLELVKTTMSSYCEERRLG